MAERFLGKKEAESPILSPGSSAVINYQLLIIIKKYGEKEKSFSKNAVRDLQKNQLLHSQNQSHRG